MPIAFVCRRCKGPPLPAPPESGRCPNCRGHYRHNRVHVREGDVDGAEMPPVKDGEAISMADLMAGKDDETDQRRPTGSPGVDHVFGGGLPQIGVVLLCAKAGSGKTTWLWGLLHKLAEEQKLSVLYISSEQSARSLRAQLQRLNLKPSRRMIILSESDHDAIIRAIEKNDPDVVVIDSLHDVENVTDESGYDMARGQPNAVARIAKEIRTLSEECGFLAFLVGHMTNDGEMKGGTHLRHTVDATLAINWSGDKKDPRRILEFEGKSRFGQLGFRSLFLMGNKGMTDCGPLIDEDNYEPSPEPTGKGPRGVN